EQHPHARDEPPAADLERLDRPGVRDRVEPAGEAVLGPFDHRLVAERPGRAPRVHGIADERTVDPEQVLHAIDLGPREVDAPGALRPLEGGAGTGPPELLAEDDLAVRVA